MASDSRSRIRRSRAVASCALILAVATAFVATSSWGESYGPVEPSYYYPPPDWRYHHHEHERLDVIVVDCSHSHRDMAWSLQWAVDHVRPNGKVMILPPGEGMTCRQSLSITKPLTISTFGGGQAAVIQAPDSEPCVEANVPLGDSLVFDGITFIARGRSAPCIRVRAGHVIVRNGKIDSRNTNFAFDVLDSGELGVEDTRIETDGAGVHALRAEVHLKNLDIDMSPNRHDAALLLDRTDGDIAGGEIVGGRWGAVVSPGPHGLSLSDLKVRNANTAVEILPGSQGSVHAERLALASNRNSVVIGPYVEAELTDNLISHSIDTGIVVYAADAHIDANRIDGGRVGIRVAALHEFDWTDTPFNHQMYDPDYDPAEPGVPEIVGNTIADVAQASILFDHDARAHVEGNNLFAPPGTVCFHDEDGEHHHDRGEGECHSDWHGDPR